VEAACTDASPSRPAREDAVHAKWSAFDQMAHDLANAWRAGR
jgi:hypothetical protein